MTELPNVKQALQNYMDEVAKDYKNKLTSDGHRATGKLIGSVKANVKLTPTQYSGELRLQDYWKYIEYGTKPHWPPKNAILKWINAKPIIPKAVNGITPTKDQLAFLIGRKISRFGTKGGGELGDAIDDTDSRFKSVLDNALSKDLNGELTLIFKDF
jgi:hypothetical protein